MVLMHQMEQENTQGRPQKGRRKLTKMSLRHDDGVEVWKKFNWHHHLFLAFGKHFFAPVDNPKQVLDVYAQSGIWSMELLKLFPESRVTMLDPDPRHVVQKHFLETEVGKRYIPYLERLRGVKGAVYKPLPFPDAQFDFTHARLPDSFLSDVTWPQLIREMARVTKPEPECYVEILCNGWFSTQRPSQLIERMLETQIQVCKALGIAPGGSRGMDTYLAQAGVVDPFRRKYPLGKKGGKERKNLIKDLTQLFLDSRVHVIHHGIQLEAEFDRDLEQFELEAELSGIVLTLERVIFQPRHALRADLVPDNLPAQT